MELKLEGASMVIKAHGSEKKANSAVGIDRYLTEEVVRLQKIKILLRNEKHRAIFAALEENLGSNEMLTDAKTMTSHTFFRFTIAARADVLPIPTKVQQRYHQPKTNRQRCNRDLQPILADILNGCVRNMMAITRRHNKVIDVGRRPSEEYMEERLVSEIDDNTVIREEDFSEHVRPLTPDLHCVSRTVGSSQTVLIDISCPDRETS
jgi:hypothetical protein